MFGLGMGPFLNNINSQIEGGGGWQAMGQRHYEKFSAELDDFLTGGGTERIVYRQTGKAWLGYKALYLLLFALRLAAGIWSTTRDVPLNTEHWLGALAMATIVPAIMLLFYLFHQLFAKPLMTPNRFKEASVKLRKWSLWDTLALLVVGLMILAMTKEILCGSLLLLGAVCSGTLYVLERRRKCVVIEGGQ